MEQREIGRSGLKVSAIGLGCNNFGWSMSAQASYPVIARALDLGVTFFDTADVYGDSEVVLGEALGARRKDVILATKFGHKASNLAGGASPDYVTQSVERSLKRLGTDYIDLLYLHTPDKATPIAQTLQALDTLIRQGKVRHIAASNMTAKLLSESQQAADSGRSNRFIASQEQFNLLQRESQAKLVPTLEALQMSLIPYFPLASGMLTGKYQRGAAPAAGTRFDTWKHLGTPLLTEQNFDRVDRLKAYAASHQHTVAELAIAWLLAKRYIPSVIAGATNPAQIEGNIRAAGWTLTAAEVSEVERLASA